MNVRGLKDYSLMWKDKCIRIKTNYDWAKLKIHPYVVIQRLEKAQVCVIPLFG